MINSMNAIRTLIIFCVFLLFPSSLAFATEPMKLIHDGKGYHLEQDGEKILMLAGELHNSTSSTYESLDKAVTTVKAMGLNSVVATAEWDLIEPEEGKFDFSSIDNIIRTADKHGIHVVLAWFATWKNGESGYAPLWVKSDTKKYFRCRDSKGENMNVISPYCKAAMEADSRAFSKMMEYIRDHDANRWISVIQVENECGVMSEMDHSKAGIAAFKAEVPNDLTEYLKANYDSLLPRLKQRWTENGCKMGGTWIQVFGDNDDARQFCLAVAFSEYLDNVTAAGKKSYDLPMYANAWLVNDDQKPGNWPAGGPVPKVLDIYKAMAKHLDWISPDLYDPDFKGICGIYSRQDNPLFIPETQRIAGPAYYAFGERNAMCYSPFAIEDVYDDPYFLGEYKVLGEILPLVAEYQGTGRMHGFLRQSEKDSVETFELGGYEFKVWYIKGERFSHGLAIQTGDDEFLFAGVGAYVTFSSSDARKKAYMWKTEELEKDGDGWKTKVYMNGDQTNNGQQLYLRGRMPNEEYHEYGFEIPAPWTDVSHQRRFWPEWQKRFKYSGIYKVNMYTFEK